MNENAPAATMLGVLLAAALLVGLNEALAGHVEGREALKNLL